jgi:uncharacterized protein YjiS (DUF1127 family)
MPDMNTVRLPYVNGSGKTTIFPKEAIMILSLYRSIVRRYLLQQSLGALLRRADDHLLDDIGLTREDVRLLLARAQTPSARSARPARMVRQRA